MLEMYARRSNSDLRGSKVKRLIPKLVKIDLSLKLKLKR